MSNISVTAFILGGDDPNGTPAFFYTQNSKKGAVTNE